MNLKEHWRRGPKFWKYRIHWWLVDRFDITPSHPLHVDIELTNHCNLKCVMCPQGDPQWQPEKGFMPKEMAKDIINQCVEMGVYSVKLQFRGESSLHKDLVEIVEYAKHRGILEVQMNTNGIPYTQEKIKGLIAAGLDRLIVSIDGATPETYSKIRVGGRLEQVEKTLTLFNFWKRQYNKSTPYVRIQMTQQEANDQEAHNFRAKWSELADEIHIKPVRSRNTGERRRCPQPFQRLVVGWNGRVYGCCNAWNEESLYSSEGVKTNTIYYLWHHKAAEWLRHRAQFRGGPYDHFEPCKSCQIGVSYK